jgi:hypothetical protein
MWIAINHFVEDAISSNMNTIDAIKIAHGNASDPVGRLAEISLRGTLLRANQLDTELRGFVLAIAPMVKLEKENQDE